MHVHVYTCIRMALSGVVCNLPCVVPLDVVVCNDLILFSCCVVAMLVEVCVCMCFCVCTVHACYEWFVALHGVQLTLMVIICSI